MGTDAGRGVLACWCPRDVHRTRAGVTHDACEMEKEVTKKVEAIGDKVTKGRLVQLGADPDLDKFMVVAFWKDERVTVGWSADLDHGDMLFGQAVLAKEIHDELFEDTG